MTRPFPNFLNLPTTSTLPNPLTLTTPNWDQKKSKPKLFLLDSKHRFTIGKLYTVIGNVISKKTSLMKESAGESTWTIC